MNPQAASWPFTFSSLTCRHVRFLIISVRVTFETFPTLARISRSPSTHTFGALKPLTRSRSELECFSHFRVYNQRIALKPAFLFFKSNVIASRCESSKIDHSFLISGGNCLLIINKILMLIGIFNLNCAIDGVLKDAEFLRCHSETTSTYGRSPFRGGVTSHVEL